MSSDDNFNLLDTARNGVYFVGDADLDPINDAAVAAVLYVARIELAGCGDKDELLTRLAAALHFPAWFGQNWDALDDCLRDLSWLPAAGYVLLFGHAADLRAAAEGDFETLLDILADITAEAASAHLPWHAFLALPDAEFDTETTAISAE